MNYIVRIPEPCSEDWNKMTPEATGRHCQVCSKTVIDFSDKTDNEIHSILVNNEGKNVCGHFRKSQVNRPMKLTIPLYLIPRNVSVAKAFAIALFLTFGTFLFSCTTDNGQTLGEVGIENRGIVMGEPTAPLEDTVKADSVKVDTTVIDEPMIDGEIMITEPMVNGGLGYYKEPLIETIPPEPQVLQEPVETMLGGAIAYDYAEMATQEQVAPVGESSDRKSDEISDAGENLNLIYPNPSNGEFNIRYEVKQKGTVQIDLFDISGKLVKNVVNNQVQNTGKYVLPSSLKDVSNGIYICSIVINGTKTTERIVIEK